MSSVVETNWEPIVPGSVNGLLKFCKKRFTITKETCTVANMNWQLLNKGEIKANKKSFNNYIIYLLKRMRYKNIYKVKLFGHTFCIFLSGKDRYTALFDVDNNNGNTFYSIKDAIKYWYRLHGKIYKRFYLIRRVS